MPSVIAQQIQKFHLRFTKGFSSPDWWYLAIRINSMRKLKPRQEFNLKSFSSKSLQLKMTVAAPTFRETNRS
jgi:hypothetical protein